MAIKKIRRLPHLFKVTILENGSDTINSNFFINFNWLMAKLKAVFKNLEFANDETWKNGEKLMLTRLPIELRIELATGKEVRKWMKNKKLI